MNTSRITQTGNQRFGLFAILESRRVVLPLKGVECEFSVCGGVVEVCVSQIFRQENPQPLDCEYLFPLPADASVYSCVADINGRVIRAEVKERNEARKIVAEKKAGGFRTALVESGRDNLFTLGLGNVQPDDLVVVRLKYFQTLRALDDTRSIEIPFCPGVRYIPGKPLLRSNSGTGVIDDSDEVPDASRISPVRIDAGHPDAAYIDVSGLLDAQFVDVPSLASPSHSITAAPTEGSLRVSLSDKGDVPDRDFVLRWTERKPDTVAPRAWVREKGDETYALLEVRAPKQVSAQRTALDFYFLVDRSGSMAGAKWDKAVEALQSCVNVLGPDDRAMVTLFETRYQDFAERPLPVRQLLDDPQFQTLRKIGTAGGTEMAPALKHVLEIAGRNSNGRDQILILITDAQIGNETAILDLMKTAPNMSVHCFGIDIALNDALLLALSRQQGGTFHSLNPNDDIQAAVTKLGQTLRQPVLLDLKLSDGWEAAEAKIPNLYSAQILYLSARFGGGETPLTPSLSPSDGERVAEGRVRGNFRAVAAVAGINALPPLELTARTPAGETVKFQFQSVSVRQEAPSLHWCKARIQRLLAESHEREAIALSTAANLLCRLTAFVAWDESQKVTVAQHQLVQPVMELAKYCVAAPAGAAATQPSRGYVSGFCERLSDTAYSVNPNPPSKVGGGPIKRLISRLVSKRTPKQAVLHALSAAGQKLGGNDWRQSWVDISAWYASAVTVDELAIRTETVKQLVQLLNLCAELMEALGGTASTDKGQLVTRVKACQVQLRTMQHKWKGADLGFKDLEALLGRAEAAAAAPTSQPSSLAGEIRAQAVRMLKLFAESLVAQR